MAGNRRTGSAYKACGSYSSGACWWFGSEHRKSQSKTWNFQLGNWVDTVITSVGKPGWGHRDWENGGRLRSSFVHV